MDWYVSGLDLVERKFSEWKLQISLHDLLRREK